MLPDLVLCGPNSLTDHTTGCSMYVSGESSSIWVHERTKDQRHAAGSHASMSYSLQLQAHNQFCTLLTKNLHFQHFPNCLLANNGSDERERK